MPYLRMRQKCIQTRKIEELNLLIISILTIFLWAQGTRYADGAETSNEWLEPLSDEEYNKLK